MGTADLAAPVAPAFTRLRKRRRRQLSRPLVVQSARLPRWSQRWRGARAVEPAGWKLAGQLASIAHIGWSLWLIALGVKLLAEEDPANRVAKLARADRIESRVEFEAGPAANNPGLRAVLRRHAPSATRQRTLEANGIDCGAGRVFEGRSYAASSTALGRLSGQESLARIVSRRAPGRSSPGTRSGDRAYSFVSHRP